MSEILCDRCRLPVDEEELEVVEFTELEEWWCDHCRSRPALVAS